MDALMVSLITYLAVMGLWKLWDIISFELQYLYHYHFQTSDATFKFLQKK